MANESTNQPWPDYYWEQLERLENLLKDCEAIDSANGTIDRLRIPLKETP